jgi:hypothetical protein
VIFHHLRGKLLGGVVGFLLRELAGLDLKHVAGFTKSAVEGLFSPAD